jgi:homing nuclease of hnh family with numod4 and ienr domains
MMHEVLADQFIPNPNNYNSIDHKDCDKLNNSLGNLEWCDIEENKRRAYDNGLMYVVKQSVTFYNEHERFTLIGLEDAGKIFGIKKSTLCIMIKRYGNKDIYIPSGSMKGYKIKTQKCKCKVQRLSEME